MENTRNSLDQISADDPKGALYRVLEYIDEIREILVEMEELLDFQLK